MNGSVDQFVTIVSGLPRSGTSLAMQMLRAGGMEVMADDVRQADEDNPRGYVEFEPVKQTARDASWLATTPGKAVKMVYRLLYDLPPTYQYRVVMMTRPMTEVLASQRVMLDRQKLVGAALDSEQLGRVFDKQMNECRAWLTAQPNFEVLEVQYNALVSNPQQQCIFINAFLGGQLDLNTMIGCVDPKLYRQRSS